MIGLLQRVAQASVTIDGQRIAAIDHGLLVLVGVQRGDSEQEAGRLLTRLLGYRVFPDAEGRMNRDVCEVAGGLLLVPQFTLAADTRSGTRPGFSTAASPDEGSRLFGWLLEQAQARHAPVAGGRFGADMQVALVNEGPVTFWLEVSPQDS
jgi:D-tyrosyl-tRNA(Tyr) deacylase